MKLKISLITAGLAIMPAFAWAGGKVVIEAGSGQERMQSAMEFEGDMLRMDMEMEDVEGEVYLLMREGTLYSVTNQGGEPMVVDLSSLGEMFGGLTEQVQQVDGNNNMEELITLDDTGRTENIAGITGDVYIATYTDASGQRMTDEVVLGSHPVLREMTGVMMTLGGTLSEESQGAAEDEAMQELLGKGDGILRFGSDYRVLSIEETSPAVARFELPAEPQQIPSLGDMMAEASAAGENASSAGGTAGQEAGDNEANPLGQLFNRQADRQQNRVESRAEREVDNAADKAVDSVVDKAVDSIFW